MIISVDNLTVAYRTSAISPPEGLTVLDIPAWRVEKGDHVAISGPSGSGKSTLLNVIAGLLIPTEGRVTVAGVELTQLGEAARDRFRAQTIGYIFQNFNLLQGYTALENVLLGMTFSHQKHSTESARTLLSDVGLAHRMSHYPRELSIGEQQRVSIARALGKRPKLILADEPTGSLDPLHTTDVIETLRKMSHDANCTLILVSHEQDVVACFENRLSFLKLNRAFTPTGGAV